jgi:fatty-acid desaturase
VVRLQHASLFPHFARYLFGKQCCSYFWDKTVRQVSTTICVTRLVTVLLSGIFYQHRIFGCRILRTVKGFHNYHHAFPWDYKAAELGSYYGNWSTAFIDLMAKIGWAYDLKSVSAKMVEKRALRTGDGSWKFDTANDKAVWGWDDKNMDENDIKMAEVTYRGESKSG